MSLDHYISKQFSNPAGAGGNVISFVMNRQNRPLYEETIKRLAISDADQILDIGCGNGYVLNLIARQNKCMLAGIDPATGIIKDASRRCHKYVKDGQMTLLCQSVNTMSFPDGFFNKAYTINTVYFWDNLDQTLADIRHILKPGGIFINTFYSNETLSRFSHTQFGYKRFTLDELTQAGRNAGFTADMIPILNGTAYCGLYQKTGSDKCHPDNDK